jgi:hypothetical protein
MWFFPYRDKRTARILGPSRSSSARPDEVPLLLQNVSCAVIIRNGEEKAFRRACNDSAESCRDEFLLILDGPVALVPRGRRGSRSALSLIGDRRRWGTRLEPRRDGDSLVANSDSSCRSPRLTSRAPGSGTSVSWPESSRVRAVGRARGRRGADVRSVPDPSSLFEQSRIFTVPRWRRGAFPAGSQPTLRRRSAGKRDLCSEAAFRATLESALAPGPRSR